MTGHNNYGFFRRYYGVPARRFAPVRFKGRRGKVTGTCGPHLYIKFDGEKKRHPFVFHPTWMIEWLEAKAVEGATK